jgi:uncharacterized protein YeaC (DUF1315 family)
VLFYRKYQQKHNSGKDTKTSAASKQKLITNKQRPKQAITHSQKCQTKKRPHDKERQYNATK